MVKKTSKNPPADEKKPENSVASASTVFEDVAKPGKTAASPTARPIIVGHKSMLKQDPMMSDAEDKEPKKDLEMKRETTIEPPTPEQSEESGDEPATETPEAPEEASSEPESSTAGAIDALADEASSKKVDQKAKDEAAKKAAELEKLITSKKYFLPIHDGVYARRGAGTILINLLLVILLIAAGVVLAQDAEYIDLGLELPFDLIK